MNVIEKSKASISHESWDEDQTITYDICEKYFTLCLKCGKDSVLNRKFQDPENTVAFLTDGILKDGSLIKDENGKMWEGCGMKLPQNTRVILDYAVAWPTIYITNSDHTITVKESPLSVDAYSNKPGSKPYRKNLEQGENAEIILPFTVEELKKYSATLVMPCFVPNTDMLTKITCKDSDDKEIILMTT